MLFRSRRKSLPTPQRPKSPPIPRSRIPPREIPPKTHKKFLSTFQTRKVLNCFVFRFESVNCNLAHQRGGENAFPRGKLWVLPHQWNQRSTHNPSLTGGLGKKRLQTSPVRHWGEAPLRFQFYTSLAPAGMELSSMTRFSFSPRSAESSIPRLSWPIIFRGARLVTATRVLPSSSSGW